MRARGALFYEVAGPAILEDCLDGVYLEIPALNVGLEPLRTMVMVPVCSLSEEMVAGVLRGQLGSVFFQPVQLRSGALRKHVHSLRPRSYASDLETFS